MSLNAEEILKAVEEEEAAAEATTAVVRPLDQENDPGNLLGIEENDLEIPKLSEEKEDYLKSLARSNVQLLFNDLFKLPTQRVDDVLCLVLPTQSFKGLPREKPVPKLKRLTKWQEYAKSKGIESKMKKKPRVVWDDAVKEWVPTYGYKRAQAEAEKNWMMEIKDNADPMEDPFEKAIQEKRERMAKNELQRLRNVARTRNVKVPGVGLAPAVSSKSNVKLQNKSELQKAADLAKRSTASLGKFQEKLSDSKLEKKASSGKTNGVKRKFDSLVSSDGSEKERSLKVLESLSNKQSKLNVTKAVGKMINQEESNRSQEKKSNKGKGRRGGKRAGKSHFKHRGGGGGIGSKGNKKVAAKR